jgi:alginate O-acetyltransferase complex protein AlgI
MVFSSSIFIFLFLPFVFLINLILPSKFRNYFLLFVSLIFYAWGEPVYVFLMLFSIVVNHFFALSISRSTESQKRKRFMVPAIIFNLVLLIFFKYAGFILSNIASIPGVKIGVPDIALPIGISFFTFHAMSYIIDIYRNNAKANNSILNVALYISFFPQLLAGPIIKYHDIADQIESRTITVDKVYSGISRFVVGLAKKLLIANILGKAADAIFGTDPSGLGSVVSWAGAIAYTLQIYFDFSGYSDMAIGLARMFGFEFKENFNYPYISRSMNEFWKRWHISLTNWFREYLYIPLGGNRKGKFRTYLNLIIVFFCTGFWHGAEWTFVIWGLTHGFFMLIEKMILQKNKNFKFGVIGNIYTLLVVTITFVIFRSPDIGYAARYIGSMFSGAGPGAGSIDIVPMITSPSYILTFIIAIPASLPLIGYIRTRMRNGVFESVRFAVILALFALCVITIAGATYNPFIYFRF